MFRSVKIGREIHSSKGFTITEMMITIGVAALLMAIAIPSFLSWLPTLRLSDGARQVAVDLQLARMKAVTQNTRFQVSFGALPATSYTLQNDPDNDDLFTNESGPFSLPEGITVTAATATPQFQPRGVATAASTITLSNGTTTAQVEVTIVGRVRIL